MPALAHIGVGLAAKKVKPQLNLWILILAAEAVELVFMILWALGIEHPPTDAGPGFSPYSHSIVSGVLISLIFAVIYFAATKRGKDALFLSLLVLSHTAMDVLASPMSGFYPADTGKQLFFNDNFSIGLGLYRNPLPGRIIEYGVTGLGLLLYIQTKISIRKKRDD